MLREQNKQIVNFKENMFRTTISICEELSYSNYIWNLKFMAKKEKLVKRMIGF